MANVVKHRFASAKSDGPDATQIQPSHWNDGHAFTGGTAGDSLIRDPTDATFGAKWGAAPSSVGAVTNNSQTGVFNDWAPVGLSGRHTIIVWAGTAATTITGITGGVLGQIVTIKNIGASAAGILSFPHYSAASQAANRFINPFSSAPIPVASQGMISYQWLGDAWYLIGHSQGVAITPPYSQADYVATPSGSWIVEASDVATCTYYLSGRFLDVTLYVFGSSVTVACDRLERTIPGGFRAAKGTYALSRVTNAGAASIVSLTTVNASVGTLYNFPTPAASGQFNVATNNTHIQLTARFEVE